MMARGAGNAVMEPTNKENHEELIQQVPINRNHPPTSADPVKGSSKRAIEKHYLHYIF